MNSSTNWFVKTTSTALYAQRSKSITTEFVKYTFLKFFFTKINELWTLHKSKFTSYLKPWGWFKCWNQLTHWFLMFWSVFKSNSYFFSNICILIIKPLFANTPCMFNVWKKYSTMNVHCLEETLQHFTLRKMLFVTISVKLVCL